MGMAHRRGYGSGVATFALLLAGLSLGAGCGNSGTATGDDGGLGGDLGAVDGEVVDTGVTVDAGPIDAGVVTDNGMTNDAGGGTDVVAVDASDGGGTDGGGGDGGVTRRGRAGASLVSAGSLMQSARFQMISTLGGRSVQQTFLQSPNYRLRGGLVGTIGAR